MAKVRRKSSSIFSEKAMIGEMILRPDIIGAVRNMVSTSMITDPEIRRVYDIIRNIVDRCGTVTTENLIAVLKRKGMKNPAHFIGEAVLAANSKGNMAHAFDVWERSSIWAVVYDDDDYPEYDDDPRYC